MQGTGAKQQGGSSEKKLFLSIVSGNSDDLGYLFEEYKILKCILDR
jgi:hypothetical protein